MKEEVLRCLLTRRSIRAYTAQAVTDEELEAVLQAGLYAPCGMGSQKVYFAAVRDKALRDQLSERNRAILGGDRDPYYGAPAIVVVLADPGRPTWVEDGACALTAMMEAAHAIGLGSCWIHRAREMFDAPEGKALLREWGLPEGLRGVGSLALGHPAQEPPVPPERKAGRGVKL